VNRARPAYRHSASYDKKKPQERTAELDELMAAIQQKTGLPADKARDAAQAPVDFLKERLLAGIGDKLADMIAGNADEISDAVGGLADKAKGLFGQ